MMGVDCTATKQMEIGRVNKSNDAKTATAMIY